MDNSFGNISIEPKVAETSAPMRESGNVDQFGKDEQERIRFEQDTRHRKYLVYWMMAVVSIWLIAVLLFTAFNKPWCLFIDNKVLITLLATTTVNVLGLANIILGGLFNVRRFYKKKQ